MFSLRNKKKISLHYPYYPFLSEGVAMDNLGIFFYPFINQKKHYAEEGQLSVTGESMCS